MSVEIELQEIPSTSRDKRESGVFEDEAEETSNSSDNNNNNNNDNDDDLEEDEENPQDEQDTYSEGDVVEIDPEEKALLPCFGRGETRRRCFLSTVVVVSIVCLLVLAFQFFVNVLLNSTISASPIIVSPFPIDETEDQRRYLVPIVWTSIPSPLPQSIDPNDVYQCPNSSFSKAIQYCPNNYVCGSNLNTSHTCVLDLIESDFPFGCLSKVLSLPRVANSSDRFLSLLYPAESSPVFAMIASVACSLIAMVSIITALVILIAKRDTYATPPPVPVNVFQWTRSKQAQDSNPWRERLMLIGIFLIIPLLLISGLLPLLTVKPEYDDLSYVTSRMCYLSRNALTSNVLSDDVTHTIINELTSMHLMLLVVTMSSLIIGFVLVLVLMALFIQRLYLVLCSKKYWIFVALMLPFVFVPLLVISFFS